MPLQPSAALARPSISVMLALTSVLLGVHHTLAQPSPAHATAAPSVPTPRPANTMPGLSPPSQRADLLDGLTLWFQLSDCPAASATSAVAVTAQPANLQRGVDWLVPVLHVPPVLADGASLDRSGVCRRAGSSSSNGGNGIDRPYMYESFAPADLVPSVKRHSCTDATCTDCVVVASWAESAGPSSGCTPVYTLLGAVGSVDLTYVAGALANKAIPAVDATKTGWRSLASAVFAEAYTVPDANATTPASAGGGTGGGSAAACDDSTVVSHGVLRYVFERCALVNVTHSIVTAESPTDMRVMRTMVCPHAVCEEAVRGRGARELVRDVGAMCEELDRFVKPPLQADCLGGLTGTGGQGPRPDVGGNRRLSDARFPAAAITNTSLYAAPSVAAAMVFTAEDWLFPSTGSTPRRWPGLNGGPTTETANRSNFDVGSMIRFGSIAGIIGIACIVLFTWIRHRPDIMSVLRSRANRPICTVADAVVVYHDRGGQQDNESVSTASDTGAESYGEMSQVPLLREPPVYRADPHDRTPVVLAVDDPHLFPAAPTTWTSRMPWNRSRGSAPAATIGPSEPVLRTDGVIVVVGSGR